jgi:hypothetical protein
MIVLHKISIDACSKESPAIKIRISRLVSSRDKLNRIVPFTMNKISSISYNYFSLGSVPTTYIGSRVGSDFPRTSILNVGSGRVGDLVGRLVGIFEAYLAKKSSSE